MFFLEHLKGAKKQHKQRDLQIKQEPNRDEGKIFKKQINKIEDQEISERNDIVLNSSNGEIFFDSAKKHDEIIPLKNE